MGQPEFLKANWRRRAIYFPLALHELSASLQLASHRLPTYASEYHVLIAAELVQKRAPFVKVPPWNLKK